MVSLILICTSMHGHGPGAPLFVFPFSFQLRVISVYSHSRFALLKVLNTNPTPRFEELGVFPTNIISLDIGEPALIIIGNFGNFGRLAVTAV